MQKEGKIPKSDTPKNKYGARKVEADGIVFSSIKEANRYLQLLILQKAGHIGNMRRQVPFILQEAYCNNNGKKILPIKYIADFVYIDIIDGTVIVEDVKASKDFQDSVYKLKKKMFEKLYPQYRFLETY